MDKRKLKNYLSCNYCEMEKNCYLMCNDYVISDKYSLICLNDSNGLNIIKDHNNYYYKKLKDYRNNFKYETHLFKTLEIDFKNDNAFININDKFDADIKKIKEIKNLIKADKFEIVQVDNMSCGYAIKIYNSKTYETGYLLPCRKH